MKFVLISLLTLISIGASGQKRLQKFNPVYGSESQVNELLAFVSTNIKVELSEDQIRGIDGYMLCEFKLDTLGNIHTIRVGHSLRPWIDYAIVGAMNRLPVYGVPATNRKGEKQEVDRHLVFSFGSFLKPLNHMGQNDEQIKANTAKSINDQRDALSKEKAKHTFAWNQFTKENSTLKYDSRDALKGNYPTLPEGKDALKIPISTPTISIKSSERPSTPIEIKTGKD